MYARIILAVGVAALVSAAPVAAQQRGTVEFGAFGTRTSYDNSLGMNSNFGMGGRVGAFIFPRLSAEFEVDGGKATRTLGRADVNTSSQTARLTLVPLMIGHRIAFLLGAGIDHADTHFFESYGYQGLAGVKLGLSDNLAIRVDGIYSHMANLGGNNKSLHFGLVVYRHPGVKLTTVYRTADAVPATIYNTDSVSAAETARLRLIAINYQALRDSLGRPNYPAYLAPTSASALAIMQRMVLFTRSSSELSPEAKEILDAKVPIFRENPEMRIVITGFASQPGDSGYNMALGLRRAEATKAYLVGRGVDPVRIEIATKGEGQLLVAGPEEASEDASANIANRRTQFRLLVADPYLVAPRKP